MNTDIKDLTSRIKIKDPTSLIIVVALVITLALFALVATGVVRTIFAQRALKADLTTATEAIESLSSAQADTPATLRSRVEQSKTQLQGLLDAFPTEDAATSEIARYYEYAGLYNTQLLRVESTMPAAALADAPVLVEYYTLDVRGQVEDLMSFIKHLADGPIDTIVVSHVAIEPDGPAKADIKLTVYYVQASEPANAADDNEAAPTLAPETSAP